MGVVWIKAPHLLATFQPANVLFHWTTPQPGCTVQWQNPSTQHWLHCSPHILWRRQLSMRANRLSLTFPAQ